MSGAVRWTNRFWTNGSFGESVFHPHLAEPTVPRTSTRGGLLIFTMSAILLCSSAAAHSGPCTAQIAQLEHQIAGDLPGPESGPTAPQTVGAQLHRQPTPGSVGQAEHVANKDGDAAIERAKKADVAGNAAECNQALVEARRLYEINN
jgi:hypothetical protein